MNIFEDNFPLTGYNTFHISATARLWAEFNTESELRHIIEECRKRSLSWYVLGGGSNVILTGDFHGVYIHPVSTIITEVEPTLFVADAGVVWDDFVAYCVDRGVGGVENLSFIPGSVGAAPVQNIGAYGAEAKDAIEWVEYLDTEVMQVRRIAGADCEFGYRTSIFKTSLKGRSVVLRVAFRLSVDPHFNICYGDLERKVEQMGGLSLTNIRRAVVEIRKSKLPDPMVTGNAGSFFKNPVVSEQVFDFLKADYPDMPSYKVEGGVKIPAGWLIDAAGWKGFREGVVGVHPAQALVLVNYGGATAEQILELAERITTDIRNRFAITIDMEVNVL